MAESAYLSLLDDYDLLGPAMASIAPRVDEIVVVDGAYRWMAPLFAATGRDPARSVDQVCDALAPYAHKTKWLTGVWDSEADKRMAGYAACRNRWIWRVDADEIHFVREAALDRFFAGGRPVGHMEIPLYIAPGYIRGRPGASLDRTGVLFDSAQIDARAHLGYLWLINPAGQQPREDAVAPQPVAFSAHLTNWRRPQTAAGRARFYVLNHYLNHPSTNPNDILRYDPVDGFAPLAQRVAPAALTEIFLGHTIVTGLPTLAEWVRDGWALLPPPLALAKEAAFAPLYTAHLDGLAALNAVLAAGGRCVASGMETHIDLSTPAAMAPFPDGSTLRFTFDAPLAKFQAVLTVLYPTAPFLTEEALPAVVDGAAVSVPLPELPRQPLRQVLRLTAWHAADKPLLHLRAGG